MSNDLHNEQYDVVTFESFRNYMSKKYPNTECLVCKSNSWIVQTPHNIGNSDSSVLVAPTIPGRVVPKEESNNETYYNDGLNLVSMQCKECGYFLFFSLDRMSENIAAFEKKQGSKHE